MSYFTCVTACMNDRICKSGPRMFYFKIEKLKANGGKQSGLVAQASFKMAEFPCSDFWQLFSRTIANFNSTLIALNLCSRVDFKVQKKTKQIQYSYPGTYQGLSTMKDNAWNILMETIYGGYALL